METVRIAPVTDQWLQHEARKFNRKKIEEYLQHSPGWHRPPYSSIDHVCASLPNGSMTIAVIKKLSI